MGNNNSEFHPLHHCHVHKLRAILNRSYAFLHFLAILAILYYRAAFFFHKKNYYYFNTPLLPWFLISSAELLLSFMWILKQSLCWRPVTRTVFPENLPKEEELLPGIDVFICTADPNKEPTFEVMNTAISAMALDYPGQKLSVYVSDDGGASVTLNGMKQAWVFATWWLPFCKRFNVKPICPKAYFEKQQLIQQDGQSKEFVLERDIVKEKYEIFKQRVSSWKDKGDIISDDVKRSAQDHQTTIQVINEKFVGDNDDETVINPEKIKMPLLVYLAREKKPSHPHHFKAGALNVLLRVSSLFSNSPYILVLDCDMYCNDSISARQAMCFYMDSKISRSLGWVQFPQKFHNISESDIYDSQMRALWPVTYPGMDGLEGPLVSGTNFYIKRKALLGFSIDTNAGVADMKERRCTYGSSNELIKSLTQNEKKPNAMKPREISSDSIIQEAQFLACCTYEEDTQWGKKIGFRYHSLVEDVMTGFMLQSQGWKSVYLNPESPQFLGSATTNLNEALVQGSRWIAGLLQIGLSKYSPLLYRSPKIQLLQWMLYIWVSIFPIDCLPTLCFAIIPPISFFYGIPLYPKVSDPFLVPFAFVFISSHLKHACEMVFIAGGSINAWLNEQRVTMIKGVTTYVYGSLACVMAKLGLQEAKFIPTNKAGDDDATKWYQIGKYDFRTSNTLLVPLLTAVTLNLSSLVGGIARLLIVAQTRRWDTLFAQLFFSLYVLTLSFPIIEGMLLRKDHARVPLSATLISTLLSFVVLSLGYFFILY